MPASEKTWRDQKALHVVFGCSGLLMLIATVWMFGADHSREWKRYQRTMRSVDVRLTQWRQQAERSQLNVQRRDELEAALEEDQAGAPPQAEFDQFVSELQDAAAQEQLRDLYTRLAGEGSSESERRRMRQRLEDLMQETVSLARFAEDNLLSQRKFKSADYDEKRANYDLGIRDGQPPDVLEQLQAAVTEEKQQRDELNLQYQQAADYRKKLDRALKAMNAPADEINKELADLEAEYDRLQTTLEERQATYFTTRPPFLGKRILELPIIDAFNSPLKIDNLWTKNLTITNGSFGSVRRFDRCTTCHRSIDRTAPGSAIDPLYDTARVLEFELATPETAPETPVAAEGDGAAPAASTRPTLLSVYGVGLAEVGLVRPDDVTVRQVLPETRGAQAKAINGQQENGLQVGDVLQYIRGTKVLSPDQAQRLLMQEVPWGQPVRIQVLRGLPQPYSTHPRLDLFVGSLSPHKMTVFACTVCHEGQGSATEFKWASHTPDNPEQEAEWIREHAWFNNHHWIYPMLPARFAESACLKCHHDVVELEIAKYDQPPAPKVTHGYHLILRYGCYGCHEINGYSGPENRIGPDIRLEPNYSGAAAQIKADPGFASLNDSQRDWVEQLIQHPDRTEVRHELLAFLRADTEAGDDALVPASHYVIPALEDVEIPGQYRKAGPSLRHVKSKVGESFLYDWLRNPKHFRPSTRMPRFFGQWNHLEEDERLVAEDYEPIEILGLVKYLLKRSQDLQLVQPEADALDDMSQERIARGKVLFETRGCLACHQHQDFPFATATHGPNLSNVGDKFRVADNPRDARIWLYSWLKNPALYHPRTKMPDLYLTPLTAADGTVTDPAADIAVYLLNSSNGWTPADDTAAYLQPDEQHLNALVEEHLKTKLYVQDVEEALRQGRIPPSLAATLDGPEAVLAGEGGMSTENKLLYVGEKTISKYGCHGCHDIPGFENAKPIGTALTDWGRKDPSRLAFEHIAEYVNHGHGHASHASTEHAAGATGETGATGEADGSGGSADTTHVATDSTAAEPAHGTIDDQFYINRLLEGDRTGFIWQKLKEPRSYDYGKARNKDSYNDRLRMPLFPLTDEEREAVITFVLGLVAEPPAYEFVYHPNAEQRALIEGHKALVDFNCIGCHIVEPESWTLEIPSGLIEEQPSDPTQTFPFMPHQFTTEEIEASAKPNLMRGTVTARVQGMPDLDSNTGLPRVLDEEGDEVEEISEYDPSTLIHPFELWRPTLIDGHAYQVGVVPLEIEAAWVRQRQPTFGGDLTKWLLPRVVELEKAVNPQADGKQAYGWLPPPLVGEGDKVQTGWMHSFLLEPFKIRPAVFMRMPRFNMSPAEAASLVSYFAARDQAVYPYEYSDSTQNKRLDEEDAAYQAGLAEAPEGERPPGETRFDHVMNIVTSSDYCVQCHMVGDFVPKTSDRAMAPDLSVVNRRLRPEYMRRWIANPKQILPYTPMPVNIKYNADAPHLGGVAQTLYHGSSVQQVDALVDLLMNYPRYAKSRALVSGLVKPATAPSTANETTAETATGAADDSP